MMRGMRWALGMVLVSILLLVGLLPHPFPNTSNAQQDPSPDKGPRVYTNDDWPFNRPRPSRPPSKEGAEAAEPSRAEHEGEQLAPFVPTPTAVVERMLEVARVTPRDVVYDLGSGDGRIVILAAQRFGAKAVGVELDSKLVRESTEKVRELGLEKSVTIVEGDLLQADIKPATVVAVYLLPEANEKLRPLLEKNLRPGTRVVAHDIRIPGWRWALTEPVQVGGGTHFVYLYEIPGAFQ